MCSKLIFSSTYLFRYRAQRTPEKPCLNDVTEVGTWRKVAVAIAMFLVILTLLPVGDELAEELGIGLVTIFWCLTCKSNFWLKSYWTLRWWRSCSIGYIIFLVTMLSLFVTLFFPFPIFASTRISVSCKLKHGCLLIR